MKRLSFVLSFLLGILIVMIPVAWQSIPGLHPFGSDRASATTPLISAGLQKPLSKPVPKASRTAAQGHSLPKGPSEGEQPRKPPGDSSEGPPLMPLEQLTKDTKKLEGLFTLYRNERTGKLFMEVRPEQFNQNYLAAMTLASGIGESALYSGMPLGDFMFTLRRVNNTVQFVIPNTYFRATAGTPIQGVVQRSFSDSVLEALPIRSLNKTNQAVVVELNPLLLTDLPGITPMLIAFLGSPYTIDQSRTYFGSIKPFPQNLEIESVYGYSGGIGGMDMPAFINNVPDSRAFDLKVRYSLSSLPANPAYRPRLADDRVGYFITAFQDFSDDTPRLPFVRYINRWHLEKADPKAELSPPKKPITFWIENTVPKEYREAIRDGILMWNQAFEKIGFKDAIEAKQMPDNADWDPADVRYNTIRWFASTDGGFALGPSRVNPVTGEILDADVLVDANFVRFLKNEFRTLVEQNQESNLPFAAQLTGNANLCNYGPRGRSLKQRNQKELQTKKLPRLRFSSHQIAYQDLCYGLEGAQQFAVGHMSLALMQNMLPSSPEMTKYVNDFLRELIAHEVGHTLGLRHNFQASAMLKPEELNNPEITRKRGLVGSVMDYNAVNLAPQGTPQGDYYTHRIGPYDEWAIEYGYKTSDATTTIGERDFLNKIAVRSAEPDLAFSTDEDVFSGLNPKVNVFDMSSDLLTYSQWQMDNARAMWQRIDKRYPLQGGSFNDVRVAFNAVFGYYFQYASFLTNYVGGQYFNRSRYGDANGRLPFEAVTLADQRKALELIRTNVFNEKAFQFSPMLLNKLAPSRWSHWGANPAIFKLDYPILDNVLFLQMIVMYDLMSYDRLSRLRDGELKNPEQTLTIPELFDTVQAGIWGDVVQAGDTLKLSGLRRALQREYLNAMVGIVLRQVDVPEDARTVARYELKQLRDGISRGLKRVDEKDVYTLAHLEEARDRITKTLEAQLQGQ
nr:zinc-dependent metalloprotease [Alkalinema sp. FACHB-956]